MDSKVDVFIKRAKSELDSSEVLFLASEDLEIKNKAAIDPESTFYSGVIAHAYYSIFYCAKAMLLSKEIITVSPEIHKKTINEFKRVFVDTSILDLKLFEIYAKMIVRADTLLEIFVQEKGKRGNFTYNTIPQANKDPAMESIGHAKTFFKHARMFLMV